MSKFKDMMDDIKNDRDISVQKNSLMLKNKFGRMFVNARDSLKEDRVGLHASAIIASEGDFCYRAQVLSLLFKQNQGKEMPQKQLAIFAAGDSIHEKWQELFERNSGKIKGFKLVKNDARSFDSRVEIYFTPDSQIELNDEEMIVEIKSMNTFAFQKAVKSNNPHPSARKQLQMYMFLRGIGKGIILIEDKNNQDFELYIIDFNYEEVLPYIDRLNEIQEMKKEFLKNGNLPCKKCKKATTKKATECGMRDACFEIGMGRIEI